METISIKDLCFAYDKTEVLHNINLTVQEGSLAVMVGPNGGGKTTLLKLMLGLIQPMYGTIELMGMKPEIARKYVAYVPQAINYDKLLPVSVMDVVLMGMIGKNLFDKYTGADKTKAMSALEAVGLAELAKRPFSELSGGERQRVLIAQALTTDTRLMLLDEPGASLDPDHRMQLYELLNTLKNTHNLTILLVSHNLNVVASFATHIICVNRTADVHPIAEVSANALANGAWTQLTHKDCPVGDQEKAALHTPHNAQHDHSQCHFCKH